MDATVVGAGIMGLTTAKLLAEGGMRVSVVSADDPLETTSAAACAVWLPLLVNVKASEARQRIERWMRRSHVVFGELATESRYGVRSARMHRFGLDRTERPPFPGDLLPVVETEGVEIDDARYLCWSFDTFVIDMPVYLRALVDDLASLKVEIDITAHYSTIDEACVAAAAPLVFNCTGLGAAGLCDDHTMRPVKGVLLLLNRVDNFDDVISLGEFVVAQRTDALVVGALFDEHFTDPQPTAEDVRKLMSFHSRWSGREIPPLGVTVPDLRESGIVAQVGGLRPVRTSGVRLERETRRNSVVIHNYGHGGAGVTLSWGAVEDAVQMAFA
jgi:D-amino-acid oxidase